MKKKNRINLSIFLLIATCLALLGLEMLSVMPNVTTPFERIEYSARDTMMRLRGPQKTSGNVVIVAIDDFTFSWTKYRWPWPRSYYAGIVDQIQKGGGKIVGLDLFLFEPDKDPGNDQSFADALGKVPDAVTVLQVVNDPQQAYSVTTVSKPLPVYMDVLDALGLTAFTRDEDAIVRSVLAFDSSSDQTYYHWAFETARLYLGVDEPTNATPTSIQFNGKSVPLNGGQLLVNYAGKAGTFPTYSAADVHDGITLEQNPDAFRDKIVLIGATTITLQDIYPTPYSTQAPTPGVEVVANAIDTILQGKYLYLAPPWVALLMIILLGMLAYFISRSERPIVIVGGLGGGMAGYLVLSLLVFMKFNFILPVVLPLLMLFLGVVIPTLEQAVSQEMEKRRVRSLFSRFIAPEMVNTMIETQDLNSLNKRADLTILFSDIRGFTTLSEKLTPEGVVNLLNPYLEAMTGVIHKHGGTVDKYEGDAIVAFFGEPIQYKDHALRTVRTAVDMLRELEILTEKWIREGTVQKGFNIGIGINSGEVFVGLLGSAQRINYTIIGDNANLAARIQDLTKAYVWPILISESTYQQVKDEFETEFADAVTVKGKTRPVNIYKVLGPKGGDRIKPWQ